METTTTTTSSTTRIVPPGFRFHPTEEELVGYYLLKKINSNIIDQYCHNLNVIIDIDLCTMEPWDIRGKCCHGAYDEEEQQRQQNEWYFFSHKGKKYPTGSRTNRATAAGFWKATGRDKAVLSKNQVIGMRKTLVFYHGRAPNGKKTDWIIHEYRLQSYEHGPPQEEGWVVCRAFRKQSANQPIYRSFLCHNNNNPLQLKFVENYSSSQYPVEQPPEIDVSDYNFSAKECFTTDWDISLDQLIELQVITDEHLLPKIL